MQPPLLKAGISPQQLVSTDTLHDNVLKASEDVQRQPGPGINYLPTELLSKVFEIVSEEQDGAIIQLSHSGSRHVPTSNDPKVEKALAYLARSGACPVDVQVIASYGDSYDPSNGVMDALYSHIPRWRSFSFHCSNSGVSYDVIKSLSGTATALRELRLAPFLRLLELNGVGVNLNWLTSLQHLETLELVQNGNSPLAYGDLLRVLSTCAASLRSLKIHATISNTGTLPSPALVLPSLQTLDLILQTSPMASVLGHIEAPVLEYLSLQDIRNPSDRWCSIGLRSFLRQPASSLRQLRLCSIGMEDDELIWALGEWKGLKNSS
ncbi:hypothetical protein RHS01_00806 [Rhizoctonia solani]|uniref:F-box domain-containing protein n=1 Tax=Rhizoctonia solani TaxID=456999 RepID=A0A8H7IK07_9AGAM|nr:hypothetical protein RHS01_00806 [Rhizoctonia solani]